MPVRTSNHHIVPSSSSSSQSSNRVTLKNQRPNQHSFGSLLLLFLLLGCCCWVQYPTHYYYYYSVSSLAIIPIMTTSPMRPFAVNVELQVRPERTKEFLQIIIQDAQQTMQTEPGAVQFTIGAAASVAATADNDTTTMPDDNTFHLHEQYVTQDDFDVHCTTPHFSTWQAFCDTQPFVTDPIVQCYACLADRVDNVVPATTTTTTFCLNVALCIRPEVREEFLSVIQHNQHGSRTREPLCVQYDYGESVLTPNHFYFHEQYIGQDNGREGFEQHTQSEHFRKWQEFVDRTNPFTKDPVVHFFTSIPY